MKLRQLLDTLQNTAHKIDVVQPMICGGAARDKYMNRLENVSDLDITTGNKEVDYLSQELYLELRKTYNITRKTMEDGHSTIFVGNLKVDFSSNFNIPNINTYLMQLGIKNPTDMQREMYSRDFTCNSLLLSLNLKDITDPTHRGFADIKNKMIRTCLNPEITLTSNRNRVVRAIYLACKLDFNLDPKIIAFVKNKPETVKISTEKSMTDKLNEAFSRDGDKASYLLNEMNLWNYVPVTSKSYPYYQKYKGNLHAL